MGKEYYKQCKMHRPVTDTRSGEMAAQFIQMLDGSKKYEEMVSWIPEKFAEVGRILKLKAEDGTWSNGWKVISVGTRQESSLVEARARDYINQRKVSDRIKKRKKS